MVTCKSQNKILCWIAESLYCTNIYYSATSKLTSSNHGTTNNKQAVMEITASDRQKSTGETLTEMARK